MIPPDSKPALLKPCTTSPLSHPAAATWTSPPAPLQLSAPSHSETTTPPPQIPPTFSTERIPGSQEDYSSQAEKTAPTSYTVLASSPAPHSRLHTPQAKTLSSPVSWCELQSCQPPTRPGPLSPIPFLLSITVRTPLQQPRHTEHNPTTGSVPATSPAWTTLLHKSSHFTPTSVQTSPLDNAFPDNSLLRHHQTPTFSPSDTHVAFFLCASPLTRTEA